MTVRRGWGFRTRPKITEPMPLAQELRPEAQGLYDELVKLYRSCNGGVDFFFYNVGTGISLAASGAAAVMAGAKHTIWAAGLSAVAAFFIAMTRILQFDARWTFGLERRARYAVLIYRLNALAPKPVADRADGIDQLYEEMGAERRRDSELPGVTQTQPHS